MYVAAYVRSIYCLTASTDSSKNSHGHNHNHLPPNPHAHITPEERLSRLLMILEAQFGAENITPISHPKIVSTPPALPSEVKSKPESPASDSEFTDEESAELERLVSIGIPVPGLEIKVDKQVARVWLETLEVECKGAVLKDRVTAVVERAVETVSPLWSIADRTKKA
jgi:cleavage and polyadenylation specificity factor subunit 3